jgi:hypothetical protein
MKGILEIFCMVAAAYNGANELCFLRRGIIMSCFTSYVGSIMVLSFVPIKNARRDSDQVPCCGEKSHINFFVLLNKSVSSSYETVCWCR